MLGVDFSIREAIRVLASRTRRRWGKQGYIEKIAGKRVTTWKLHWYVYVDYPDGTRKRHHRARTLECSQYSRADANAILRQIIEIECNVADNHGGAKLPAGHNSTVEEFYRNVFLPTRQWEKNTAANAEFTWRKYVGPALGSMRLGDVKRFDIDMFFRTLDGKGRSTIIQVRNAVKTIFGYAEENGFIGQLRIPKISLKRFAKPSPETKVLTLQQARACCKMAGEHGLVYRLILTCGLRIGELLVLRWGDILPGILRVDESIEMHQGVKSTKGREVRDVPLPQPLAEELAERKAESRYTADSDFIFCKSDGTHISRTAAWVRWIEKARSDSGIPNLDFHCCRRTCATLLDDVAKAGIADVQAILGHSEPVTTEKHYIKPVQESQRRAIDMLNAELMGTGNQQWQPKRT